MCSSRPRLRRKLPPRSSGLALSFLGIVFSVCGCNFGTPPAPPGGGPALGAITGGNLPDQTKPAFAKAQPLKDSQKTVSTIAGDRLQVIPKSVVMTKQTESSPFRFAEIDKEAGIDFVHFSGMTDEKPFPTANG